MDGILTKLSLHFSETLPLVAWITGRRTSLSDSSEISQISQLTLSQQIRELTASCSTCGSVLAATTSDKVWTRGTSLKHKAE